MELPNIPHEVSYRDIKYPRLEFKTGNLLIVLPFGHKSTPLLEKHKSWVLKKGSFIEECLKEVSNKKIVGRSEEEFKDLTLSFVKEASKELGKGLNKVYFRKMRTKWASCSPKKNLTIKMYFEVMNKEKGIIPDSINDSVKEAWMRCH